MQERRGREKGGMGNQRVEPSLNGSEIQRTYGPHLAVRKSPSHRRSPSLAPLAKRESNQWTFLKFGFFHARGRWKSWLSGESFGKYWYGATSMLESFIYYIWSGPKMTTGAKMKLKYTRKVEIDLELRCAWNRPKMTLTGAKIDQKCRNWSKIDMMGLKGTWNSPKMNLK